MEGSLNRSSAFDSFYREHYMLVLRFAERRVDHELARDVCAECFIIVLRKFDEDEPPALPWLYQTARNVIGSAYRKKARDLKLLNRLHNELLLNLGNSERPDLIAALETLKPNDREAIQLTYWEGLTAAEVGAVLRCSEQAAWKRISRAKKTLKTFIELANQQDLGRAVPTDA
jgi:RNA polymerase sigma-70 factor (ECF subfamily)